MARPDRLIRGRSLRLQSPVVILEPNDVVLAEVITMLNLDQHQWDRTAGFNAMRGTARDIYGVSRPGFDGLAIQGDQAVPGDNEPVLGAALVPLVTQPLARADLEHLDFEVIIFG